MTDKCDGKCQGASMPDKSASFASDQALQKSGAYVSQFDIPKMDCPSEERIITMALDTILPSVSLEFDTPNRKLRVYHESDIHIIQERLESLRFGASLESTEKIDGESLSRANAAAQETAIKEAFILKWLLAINAIMFCIEFVVGWIAQSTALIADALDMFADASVYGLALYVVGRSSEMKLRVAHLSGWLQMMLALGALSEVVRRFIFGSEPVSTLMISFGLLALLANVSCLMMITKSRSSGSHMKASWIFSANDVIANIGVVLAGILVYSTGSRYPDLFIALIIAAIVLTGARRILQIRS